MSTPCVDEGQFDVTEGAVTPRGFMQWRHVATDTAPAVVRGYPPLGPAIYDTLTSVLTQWVNDSPIPQRAYALLTRGGSSVTLTARSRAFIQTEIGHVVSSAPVDPALTLESRFGVGFDRGVEAFTYPRYAVLEQRTGGGTTFLGDTKTVAPGEAFSAKATARFISENWETVVPWAGIAVNGDVELEARAVLGEMQIDIFAYPAL